MRYLHEGSEPAQGFATSIGSDIHGLPETIDCFSLAAGSRPESAEISLCGGLGFLGRAQHGALILAADCYAPYDAQLRF